MRTHFLTLLLFSSSGLLQVVLSEPSDSYKMNKKSLYYADDEWDSVYSDGGAPMSRKERHELIRQWAPLVWIHPDETFYPSSVIHFLKHITPSKPGRGWAMTVLERGIRAVLPSLPDGKSSVDAFLNAPLSPECPDCELPPFLYGEQTQDCYQPPIYAAVYSCDSEEENWEVPAKFHGNKKSKGSSKSHRRARDIPRTTESNTTLPYFDAFRESQLPPDDSLQNRSSLYENEQFTQRQSAIEKDSEESNVMNGKFNAIANQKYRQMRLLKRKAKLNKQQPSSYVSDSFSVHYWMFFPFNFGKMICTTKNDTNLERVPLVAVDGKCAGEEIVLGNHVGDWEHITIQFKGRIPTALYLSCHDFGSYYDYDIELGAFIYSSFEVRKGFPVTPEIPCVVKLKDNHPVVYTALKSHGIWAKPGIHELYKVPHLTDNTAKGTPWQSWLNVEILDMQHPETFTPVQRHWMSYEGHWGNEKRKCHDSIGSCELANGPEGIPLKRNDFPC